jgi:hypothetical protein
MRLGELLWLIAVAIAVIVGLAYFGHIHLPIVTAPLMRDSTLSLFIALGLAVISKRV